MTHNQFHTFLNKISKEPLRVFNATIAPSKYVAINLSESNEALKSVNLSSSDALSNHINLHIENHQASIAFGGYNETRAIYKRSEHFNIKADTERNIHIGLDLWCKANTPVLVPLDAQVHSFKNNTNFGDYGPTIILKHTINKTTFYTLYGHLSEASISKLKVHQEFKQGQQLATLGEASVNGDYPPHLHFQIIKDIDDYYGDYPGVCNKKDLDFYLNNCPNPNLLLKLEA